MTFDRSLLRAIDSYHTAADSSKITATLGWRAKMSFVELVTTMVDYQVKWLAAAKPKTQRNLIRTGTLPPKLTGKGVRARSRHGTYLSSWTKSTFCAGGGRDCAARGNGKAR